jgi:CRISPR system Cascade subunit CasE
MMYLSTLLINVGTNPDRPRPGRLWLRNRYRVHQRLCMAFPSASRRSEDVDFLKPFKPEDFGVNQVHVSRGTSAGFLFRIDPQPEAGRAVILVQSAAQPDWDYAFHNAGHLLIHREMRPFNPHFEPSHRFRFCILANPVRKVSKKSLDFGGKLFDERWHGKDVPVPTADLATWLERRAEPGWSAPKNSEGKQPRPGFRLVEIIDIQAGYVYVNKNPDEDSGRRLRSARYEGVLEVTDAVNFRNTIIRGIGSGKAFGFGLLSIAPVHR